MTKPTRKKQEWALTGPVPASKAKTHFLELISSVSSNGSELVITKRGKPVVKLVPFCEADKPDIVGCMKGTFEITGDVISPEPDLWDAMQ